MVLKTMVLAETICPCLKHLSTHDQLTMRRTFHTSAHGRAQCMFILVSQNIDWPTVHDVTLEDITKSVCTWPLPWKYSKLKQSWRLKVNRSHESTQSCQCRQNDATQKHKRVYITWASWRLISPANRTFVSTLVQASKSTYESSALLFHFEIHRSPVDFPKKGQ